MDAKSRLVKDITLKDIRYFETGHVPAKGEPFQPTSAGFKLPKDVHRLGQRIACLLESEKFSIGSADHLYVALTSALAAEQIVCIGPGFERWQTYVAFGLSPRFKTLSASAKLDRIAALTFEALRMLVPQQAALLENVRLRLLESAAGTLVLLMTKDIKTHRFEVWFNVPAVDEQAYLHVVARENATGRRLEAPPFPLADYRDVFALVSSISTTNDTVKLMPRSSFRAKQSTAGYALPLHFPLSVFAPANDD